MNEDMKLPISQDELRDFCQRWQITSLALFGSAVRDDFNTDSDLDFLVTFHPSARHTLFDMVRMERELVALSGRPIDLISRRAIETSTNYLRRHAILSSAQEIYAA
jgi:hypothetical protein